MTESLLLAVAGGGLGILAASWTVQLLVGTATLDIPRIQEVQLDSGVLVFAFGLTLFTGLLFGALPAWRSTRSDPQEALRAGGRAITEGSRGMRFREGLISLEVGLSATLLIVAGLLTSSLTRLTTVDKGFDDDHVLTVDFSLAASRYPEAANREAFYNRFFAKLDGIPGVQSYGVVTALPTRGETWMDPIRLEGDGSRRHPVNNRYASPGYFRAMNIAIRSGRAFAESDRGREVAMLSEKAATLLWPGEPNPLGRRFVGEEGTVQTLVGIVADVRAVLAMEPPPTVYYPGGSMSPAAFRWWSGPREIHGRPRGRCALHCAARIRKCRSGRCEPWRTWSRTRWPNADFS
jgi:hypothetical protein